MGRRDARNERYFAIYLRSIRFVPGRAPGNGEDHLRRRRRPTALLLAPGCCCVVADVTCRGGSTAQLILSEPLAPSLDSVLPALVRRASHFTVHN